jgi:glycosidase
MSDMNPKSLDNVDFKPQGEVFPSPIDWRDHFIYFLLVDRFNDGKERPPYNPNDQGLKHVRNDLEGDKWQGGKIKGITEKLDYIRDLGCTAIWLSPIFKNRKEANTYHGYAIQNFLDIDPRFVDPQFGTVKDLQDLVRTAHEKGIYVILDIVLNHTGDNWGYPGGFPYYYSNDQTFDLGFWRGADGRQISPESASLDIQWPDDAIWPREFQKPEWYRRKGEIRNWDAFPEARDGDICSLKDLDTSNPSVLRALIDIFKYWIAVADVDGFRLDTVKHLEESGTAIFCNAIREYAMSIGKRNFILFGEIKGDDKFIDQYIGRNARTPTGERFPSLDAALDFPLWNVLEWVIKGFQSHNPAELRARYDSFRDLYADHGQAGQYFVTFIDNHDQIGRNPKGRFLYKNPYKDQAVLGIGYLLTSLGVPCIYYGTEQGFDGGVDNDREDKYIRECMFGGRWGAFGTTEHHFFDPNHDIFREISKIAKVREKESALRYGRQYFREISGNGIDFGFPIDGQCTLAYSRILDDTEILMAMNLGSNPRSDYVTVDRDLIPAGKETMVDLLRPTNKFDVVSINCGNFVDCRHAVQIPLNSHDIAVLKLDGKK